MFGVGHAHLIFGLRVTNRMKEVDLKTSRGTCLNKFRTKTTSEIDSKRSSSGGKHD
ncbi:uncharacterized protein V6R79_016115 [Siganus canaliculatus]